MKFIFRSGLIAALLLLLTGCATKLNTYPGKTLSQAESGILTCEPQLRLSHIDGNAHYAISSAGGRWFRECVVSLTPGKRPVTFRYLTGGTVSFSTGYVTHDVNIEKGHIYRIKYKFDGSLWKPWIEQLKGDELKEQRKRVTAELAGK